MADEEVAAGVPAEEVAKEEPAPTEKGEEAPVEEVPGEVPEEVHDEVHDEVHEEVHEAVPEEVPEETGGDEKQEDATETKADEAGGDAEEEAKGDEEEEEEDEGEPGEGEEAGGRGEGEDEAAGEGEDQGEGEGEDAVAKQPSTEVKIEEQKSTDEVGEARKSQEQPEEAPVLDVEQAMLDGDQTEEYQAEVSDSELSQEAQSGTAKETEAAALLDFLLAMEEEEVEEETTESSESTPTPLYREPLIDTYVLVMQDYGKIKRLNNFLHKKMGDYFKKRKMEHVLREGDTADEVLAKYGQKLDNFAELIEMDRRQRAAITEELDELRQLRDEQFNDAQTTFEGMISREKEIGRGLISTKTGKEIPEKFLEKLISNQVNKAGELQQLRLTHIKIRNAVAENNIALRALDKIGENCTLMEFEQLKMENQGHVDKIEERDEELTRLRKKCNGAIQCLAHVREKCSAIETDIKQMKTRYEDKEKSRTDIREHVNRLKVQRDYLRNETQRMKDESGLLTKDKLLLDMEESMKEIEIIQKQKDTVENTYNKRVARLRAVRKNCERYQCMIKRRLSKVTPTNRISILRNQDEVGVPYEKRFLKRPTIVFPVFTEEDDDALSN